MRRMRPSLLAALLGAALLSACGADDAPAAAPSPDAPPLVDAAPDAPDVPDVPALMDGAPPARDATAPGDGPAAHDAGPPAVHGFVGRYSSPSIVRVGSRYHAWFAAQSIGGRRYHAPHATFTADGDFTFEGEGLPHLGARAEEDGVTWAPGVARLDASHWMIYYTAHLLGTPEKKCLWRAHADGPGGPFVDDFDGPLFCADGTLWAIDAYPVEDSRGGWYLGARIDQPGGINTIQLRALGPFGRDFAPGSRWVELTHNAPSWWEQPVMENAGIVRLAPPSGQPHWFVFYSARAWDGDSYAVGYADCGTGLGDGACTRVTTTGPWLATDAGDGVYGPGTPTFYTDEAGDTLMSVQAWRYSGGTSNPRNQGQIMRTYRVTVNDALRPRATLVRVDL